MMLTEERLEYLARLAMAYAEKIKLDVDEYVAALFNTDNLRETNELIIVETLIKYHEEWLKKAS